MGSRGGTLAAADTIPHWPRSKGPERISDSEGLGGAALFLRDLGAPGQAGCSTRHGKHRGASSGPTHQAHWLCGGIG